MERSFDAGQIDLAAFDTASLSGPLWAFHYAMNSRWTTATVQAAKNHGYHGVWRPPSVIVPRAAYIAVSDWPSRRSERTLRPATAPGRPLPFAIEE